MTKFNQFRFVLRGHGSLFIATIVVIFLSSITQSLAAVMLYPLVSKIVLNGDKTNGGHLELINLSLFGGNNFSIIILELCILLMAFFILNYLQIVISRGFSLKVKRSLSEQIFRKYLDSGYSFFLQNKQGVLLNNLIIETDRVEIAVRILSKYIYSIVLSIFLIVVTVIVSWKLALPVLILGAIVFLTIRKLVFEFSQRTGKKRVALAQQVNSIAAETISGIKQIKLFDFGDTTHGRMTDCLKNVTKLLFKFSAIRQLPGPAIKFFVVFLVILLVLFNMRFAFFESTVILPLVVTFVYIAMRLFDLLSALLTAHMNLVSCGPSIEVIHRILTEDNHYALEKTEASKINIDKINKGITIKDLDFSYSSSKKLYKDLNLKINMGSRVGFVGHSGSGKSSLVNLLTGLFTFDSGDILIDNTSLKRISLVSYRKRLGVVSQDTFIFHGSISNNIRMGKPLATDDEVIKAAKLAKAHDFITKLPDTYDTIIGEKGTNLSGGECQRITIARALIRDPDVLIFDEATNSLDKESEIAIGQSINKLAKNKAVIIITHNWSFIADCDIIHVFDDGMIIESGSHDDLLKAKKEYWRLYNENFRTLNKLGTEM